jgi:hypothetical protein
MGMGGALTGGVSTTAVVVVLLAEILEGGGVLNVGGSSFTRRIGESGVVFAVLLGVGMSGPRESASMPSWMTNL